MITAPEKRYSPITICAFCTLLITLISFTDYLTGHEISVFIFYAVPIALASWYGNKELGFFTAILSAIGWISADIATDFAYSHWFIPYWNGMIRISFFTLTAFTIDALRDKLDQLQQNAHTDILTNLFNARGFRERTEILFTLLKREKQSYALVFVDVDNFKSVNDTKGHAEGDRLLISIAKTMIDNLRQSDVIGRMGGDEFVIFLPRASMQDTKMVITQLKEKLDAMAKAENWPIGFSIGMGIFNSTQTEITNAIEKADTLMYEVKKDTKGKIRSFNFTNSENVSL